MVVLLNALLATAALADTPLDGLPAPLRARFEAAEAAWQKGELDAADAAFGEVIAGQPEFDRAFRRRCGVRLAEERFDEALTDCEKARALVPGLENDTALAIALLWDDRPKEAKGLIDGALKLDPDFKPARVAQCTWAAKENQKDLLDACSRMIEQGGPGTPGALYFQALAKLSHGDIDGARSATELAQSKGLPEDLVRGVAARAQDVHEAQERHRKAQGAKTEAKAWSAQDLIPIAAISGVILTLAVLWFGRDDKSAPKA